MIRSVAQLKKRLDLMIRDYGAENISLEHGCCNFQFTKYCYYPYGYDEELKQWNDTEKIIIFCIDLTTKKERQYMEITDEDLRRPKGGRILQATQDDLNKVFDEIYNQASEENLIDDIDENGEFDFSKLEHNYSIISEYWEKNKSISAGDYEIVDVESIDDIRIPNACYGDAGIIFL